MDNKASARLLVGVSDKPAARAGDGAGDGADARAAARAGDGAGDGGSSGHSMKLSMS